MAGAIRRAPDSRPARSATHPKMVERGRAGRRPVDVQRRGDATGRECYAPNNVANMVEFSVSVPREELRPGYGHGFLGAPLTEKSLDKPTQQDRGEECGKSKSRPTRRPGGHSGV